ncbi:MAG: hypothetical protein NZ742_05420 [Acidobacteria bacterium]|nr:hypothetical protein [Acidobacteriota bacterium]MDW7984501.1 cytochrome c3 family protein [Acidobacteriota bacterium]
MKQWRRPGVFGFILVQALAQTQASDPVLYPPSGVHLLGSRVSVVAEADDVQTTVQVLKKVRTGSFVHLVLSLPWGKHELTLVIVQKGQVLRQSRTVHVFPSRHYVEAPLLAFHEDQAMAAACAPCHRANAGAEGCLRCHPDKAGKTEVPHEGYDPADCGACHQNGTGPAPASACAGCHEATSGRLHAPYAVGDCRLCHDPHGASRKHLLTAEVTPLCGECHSPEEYAKGGHPVSNHPVDSKNFNLSYLPPSPRGTLLPGAPAMGPGCFLYAMSLRVRRELGSLVSPCSEGVES